MRSEDGEKLQQVALMRLREAFLRARSRERCRRRGCCGLERRRLSGAWAGRRDRSCIGC